MTKALKTITVENLIVDGLLHEATSNKYQHKFPRINEILGGSRATEAEVTTFLTMSDGLFERAVIGMLCDAAGIQDRTSLRLLSGTEFRLDSEITDRRSIDMVIASRIQEGQASRGSLAWHPIAGVEAKYDAWVNGAHGYCNQFPDTYSNQAICYLHGCIDERLDIAKGVKFIWLSNAPKHPEYGPWDRKGIHEGDFGVAGLEEAYAKQAEAKDKWTAVTWEGLGDAVLTALSAEGYTAEAEAIVRLLRADG